MLTVSATCVLISVLAAGTGNEPSPVGRQVAVFQLNDCLGSPRSLDDWKEKKAVVVVFFGTQCPLARSYAPRLAELAQRYRDQSVQFVGINSNRQDSLADVARFAREMKLDFPVLKDPGNKIADQFSAERTPEAFLLDADRKVRYWGAIDDQYGIGFARAKAGKQHSAAALGELLAGQAVSTSLVPAAGCRIGRVSRAQPKGNITYNGQIAGILNKHCVNCHRPGQIAPFSLTTYEETVGWAETIREVIREGRMPPWLADPHYGSFQNDARMSDEEKKLVDQWIENGLPQGDSRELADPPKFVEGWRISRPDLVVRMPEPFNVPAKGPVPYQYFVVDPQFKEDVWVRGAEGRPGNRAVVHHLILFYLPPGQQRPRPQDTLMNSIASFVPGMPASDGPHTHARHVPAGSKLIFQIHYTPNGIAQTDQSEAGLLFADPKKVEKSISINAAVNFRFEIPPRTSDHLVESRFRFAQDSLLYTLSPHMHLRGKSFRFTAVYPDKSSEVLLDVPRYDFNWQNVYLLKKPKPMPEATEVICQAHFDNSANNPVNPDPSKAVHWGDQTWEEMAIGTFATSPMEQDLTLGLPRAERLENGRFSVRFRYKPTDSADAVYLAGAFNGWKPDGHKMDGPDNDGFYATAVELEKGRHEYKFVVNGKTWKQDPGNAESTGYFHNSVIRVGGDARLP